MRFQTVVGLRMGGAHMSQAGVGRLLRRKIFANGELVFREGDVGMFACLIEKGSVLVIKGYGTPRESFLARLGPGEIVGEMALVDASVRSATVVCEGIVVIDVITDSDFKKLLLRAPAGLVGIMKTLIRRLRDTSQKCSA